MDTHVLGAARAYMRIANDSLEAIPRLVFDLKYRRAAPRHQKQFRGRQLGLQALPLLVWLL